MISLLLAGLVSQTAPAAEIGKPAPNFTLPGVSGKSHSLSDFRGKIVVLEWTNDGCPFVKKFYGSGEMQRLQKWATDKKVVWLSVNSSAEGKQGYQTAETGKALMKDQKWASSALLLDHDGTVGKLYGAKTTPHMYIVDKDGTLVYMGGIDDKPTPNPADIAGARNHVKAALEELWAGKAVSVPTSKPYGCGVKYKG